MLILPQKQGKYNIFLCILAADSVRLILRGDVLKKLVLLGIVAALIFCGCQNREPETRRLPSELPKLKASFSALYTLLRQENFDELPSDALAALAPEGGTGLIQPRDSDRQKRFSAKSDFYFKEILQYMESIRISEPQETDLSALAQQLDACVNRMGHQLNQMNLPAAQEAINDGIEVVAQMYRCCGREEAAVLHLEYCLNLLEIASGSEERLSEALDLTQAAIDELEGEGNLYRFRLSELEESLKSLRDAALYRDSRLVCMKVAVMREGFEDISALTPKRE